MQFDAKVYLEFSYSCCCRSRKSFFHLLGVSVCGMCESFILFLLLLLSLSTYPSPFCSFRSSYTIFFLHCTGVAMCTDTNGKLTGNGTFYLECLYMCKLCYSQFHATLVLLSFGKFLDSLLLLLWLVVCYTFFTCSNNLFIRFQM